MRQRNMASQRKRTCLGRVLILACTALTEQGCMAQRTADTVAEQLARSVVCEAYTGGDPNAVACDWTDIPLDAHLAMVTPESATVALPGVPGRFRRRRKAVGVMKKATGE